MGQKKRIVDVVFKDFKSWLVGQGFDEDVFPYDVWIHKAFDKAYNLFEKSLEKADVINSFLINVPKEIVLKRIDELSKFKKTNE